MRGFSDKINITTYFLKIPKTDFLQIALPNFSLIVSSLSEQFDLEKSVI